MEKHSFCSPGEKHPEQTLWREEEGGSREAESGSVRERRVGQAKEGSPLGPLQARSWVLPASSSASGAVCKVSPGELEKHRTLAIHRVDWGSAL